MPELPSGTVTMFFSDIEGSTSLLTRLGTDWGAALSAHRRIVREVVALSHGVEIGTEGDSFFVVFASAQDAVAAAVEAQRRLARQPWPGGVALKVRIGLHTGAPERHEEGYVGLDVHRAARIAATAHGGQVVLSEPTADRVAPQTVGVELRDLGLHRLKDLADPERLFDVVGEGLAAEFPPLRSLGSLATLPSYPTELLGREPELTAVTDLLDAGGRLVTLIGPGGSGKTRLAVAVAERMQRRFPGRLFLVELASATSAALMWAGIAESVGAVAEPEQSPEERALSAARGGPALLVLDNLEQVPDAEAVVARMLDEAPDVQVLATSRRPLHLVSEQLYPVPPLSLPSGDAAEVAAVEGSPAVTLFVRRARMVNPGFRLSAANAPDVVALCRRLDGLPLAIELVAARCRLLSPRALVRRLDAELGRTAVDRDRSERHKTLSGTVAWSYDLLSDSDQVVFRRLGVFAGRVTLEAVERVVGSTVGDLLDSVAHLVDVSLLDVVEGPDGEPLLSMLETIRGFARSRLGASGEHDEVRLRHAQWCAEAAAAVTASLHGPHQMRALDRMAAIGEDVRTALDWTLVPAPDSTLEQRECGYRLLAAMGPYWYRFGHVFSDTGDQPATVDTVRRALEIDRALGDAWGTAVDEVNLVTALLHADGPEAALDQLVRSARGAVALEDAGLSIQVLETFAAVLAERGDPEAAARLLGAADAHRDRVGLLRSVSDTEAVHRFVQPARAACGADAWTASYEAGRGSSVEQAVEDALAGPGAVVP